MSLCASTISTHPVIKLSRHSVSIVHFTFDIDICKYVSNIYMEHDIVKIQLGQPSVNPPRLVLEVGGTSTLQAAMPVKLKSPHLEA